MKPSVIPLSRLLDLDVPRSWQEVVAVTMAVGEAAEVQGTSIAPVRCYLSGAGVIEVEPGAEPAEPGALAGLLGLLLEGQAAPAELRELASRQTAGRPRDLLGALAYFERPDRQADLMSLATRALAADESARAEEELSRLRRASPRASREPPASRPSSPQQRARRTTTALVVAVVAWFLVGMIATYWYLSGQPPFTSGGTPPATAAGTPAATDGAAQSRTGVAGMIAVASDAIASVADAGMRAIGLAAPVEEARPPAPPTRAATPAPVPHAPAARSPTDPPPEALPPLPASSNPAGLTSELPAVAADPPDALSPPPPAPIFYTQSDADVTPPELVYPQLRGGSISAPVPPGTAYFEILVNAQGTVDRVRLFAPQPRLRDRMMVSAAKAWRFKPATKDGQPVRYLMKTRTAEEP